MVSPCYPNRLHVGETWANLPGRAVALTFALIAARYYANIYSTLSVTGLGGPLQQWANIFLRFNSFSYFVPIMVAIVYEPHWWPYCAFVGTLIPALNNFFCLRVAKFESASAMERLKDERASSVSSTRSYHQVGEKDFVKGYSEWFTQMVSYSFTILAIGVFISLGWAKDEWPYAALVCLVNIGKIYRNNCGLEAPGIVGYLARTFFRIRQEAAINQGRPCSIGVILRLRSDSGRALNGLSMS